MHVAVFAGVFASASKGERWRVTGNLSPAGSKVILYSFPAPSDDVAGDSHAPASYVGATWLNAEAEGMAGNEHIFMGILHYFGARRNWSLSYTTLPHVLGFSSHFTSTMIPS